MLKVCFICVLWTHVVPEAGQVFRMGRPGVPAAAQTVPVALGRLCNLFVFDFSSVTGIAVAME